MANEDKGRISCPFCKTDAPVRQNKKGKYYFNCPSCGIVQPHGTKFQGWMMDNAKLFGADGAPEDAAPVEARGNPPPVDLPPVPTPPPAPAKADRWSL